MPFNCMLFELRGQTMMRTVCLGHHE